MDIMYRLLIFFAASLLVGACHNGSSSFFMKRKYTRGVYFEVAKHVPSVKKVRIDTKRSNEKNVFASVEKKFVEQKLSPIKNSPSIATQESTTEKRSSIHPKKKTDIALLKNILDIPFHKTEKNSSAIQKRSAKSIDFDGTTLAIGLVGFVLLTLVYTISILQTTPGINPLVALCVAMVFAAITVVTGVYLY